MIPYLVREKLELKYGKEFVLPAHIDLLRSNKESYKGDEHELQKSFFQWLATFMRFDPFLYLFHAIPNGGTRDKITAGRLKAEGVKAGIPDTFLPIPKGHYKGLYIEFKTKVNKPSDDQRMVLLMLDELGYRVVCVNTFEDAVSVFNQYMKG